MGFSCQPLVADYIVAQKGAEHVYDVPKDDEDNIVAQGLMKDSINSQDENDTLVEVPCSNVESR